MTRATHRPSADFRLTLCCTHVAYPCQLQPARLVMASSHHAASSPAGNAGTQSLAPGQNWIKSATGYYGPPVPALLDRIGGVPAAHRPCARVPVRPTAASSHPHRANGPTAGYGWAMPRESPGCGSWDRRYRVALHPDGVSGGGACIHAPVRSPDRNGIADSRLEMTAGHVRSLGRCERWRLAGRDCMALDSVTACAAAARAAAERR